MLRGKFPGIPVILDAKRGDIATSSTNYAREAFEAWHADCVTVSPYMGTDSVMPFAFADKGVYVLNRTIHGRRAGRDDGDRKGKVSHRRKLRLQVFRQGR